MGSESGRVTSLNTFDRKKLQSKLDYLLAEKANMDQKVIELQMKESQYESRVAAWNKMRSNEPSIRQLRVNESKLQMREKMISSRETTLRERNKQCNIRDAKWAKQKIEIDKFEREKIQYHKLKEIFENDKNTFNQKTEDTLKELENKKIQQDKEYEDKIAALKEEWQTKRNTLEQEYQQKHKDYDAEFAKLKAEALQDKIKAIARAEAAEKKFVDYQDLVTELKATVVKLTNESSSYKKNMKVLKKPIK